MYKLLNNTKVIRMAQGIVRKIIFGDLNNAVEPTIIIKVMKMILLSMIELKNTLITSGYTFDSNI
jgi:hypothetical protein